MNTPYIKAYDKNGNVSNPIKGIYKSEFANRKQRRSYLQKERYFGARLQIEFDKNGNRKVISHDC